jgi:YesN/AraC family two-component response regulator
MPEMAGLTLLSKLVNQSRIYQTIVISAYGDMPNIRKAMNQGASDFITKPVDLNDLGVSLRRALDQYESIKEAVAAISVTLVQPRTWRAPKRLRVEQKLL